MIEVFLKTIILRCMKSQLTVQKLLLTKLAELQAKNPSFSLRALARRGGVSPATLSLVLSGRRNVSRKLVEKLSQTLGFDPRERAELLRGFANHNNQLAQADKVDPNYVKLSTDQFRVIADWYYFAILSLVKTQGFNSDPKWIAQRLGIKVSEAKTAIDRLKRLEILVADGSGGLTRTAARYFSSDDVRDLSVRRSHFQSLELAQRSLEEDAIERRDFSSMTMAIYPSKLSEAKTRIRKFLQELDAFLEAPAESNLSEKPQEVYRLSIQLFPLSKELKRK